MAVSNTFKFVDWLTMESLRILKNKLHVAQFMNTSCNKEYTKTFAVGETVRVKLPQRYTIRDGLTYSPQALNRLNTTVKVDQVFGIDFEWDSVERALKMERRDFVKREYIDPAMAQIASEIDSRAALWAYQNTNNIVGVLGTDPTAFTTVNQARARMVELACPPGGKRGLIIPPAINVSMANAAVGYFQPASSIAKQYKEGSIGRAQGYDWYESMSLYSHTAGTWSGAVTVRGASQDGSSLNITCTSGDTFLKGDVFSIASCLPVNPMTRRKSSTTTKQFVVTEALTATSTTETLQISPAIFGPGSQYQNVDSLPGNAAALTLFPGTTSPNGLEGINGLAIHSDAFAMVGVDLEKPDKAELSSRMRDPETGISIRFVRMFDPKESKMVNRFDVLMGFGNLYPDNCAVRLLAA